MEQELTFLEKELTFFEQQIEKKKEISNLLSYVKDNAAKKVILQNEHVMGIPRELRRLRRNIKNAEVYDGKQQPLLEPIFFS